ncbi:MAG: trehalose-phosphatase [Caldilineales bacterium]|nr:trehalose-phosphatase [Caldilineales bacterium]
MTPCESASIWRPIESAPRLWLFLDYDGTLADFAPTPDHIQPDATLIALVTRLVQTPDLRISIISGRRLSHIQQLLPIDGLMIAGTYGIEMRAWNGEAITLVDLSTVRPLLRSIKQEWQGLIAGQHGFYLEDKDWSLAIHAKDAAPSVAEQVIREGRRLANEAVTSQPREQFRILGGNRFLEIGPSAAHKGRTIDFLFARYPMPDALPIYIGDDDKDEEAFEIVKAHGGMALAVMPRPRPTIANCRLESPAATRRWLLELIARRNAE